MELGTWPQVTAVIGPSATQLYYTVVVPK